MSLKIVFKEEDEMPNTRERVSTNGAFAARENPRFELPPGRKFKRRFHESRIIKSRPMIPIDESETDVCITLWRSVVVQALYDMSGKSGNHERKLVRAQALTWFFAPESGARESDFEQICHLANLAPGTIRRAVKEVRENGEELGFNFRTVRRKFSVCQRRE
jgi:hypothetical protein